MGTGVNARVSPGRVVLIFTVLLAAWLAFQFFPRRKEPAPSLPPVKAESRLRAAGLADNPDWDGLPEIFAVWADKIDWNENKACFAYWHPGARTYAYFFEVTRQAGGVRFREISPQWLSGEGYDAEDGESAMQVARRESESPTHPFVFLSRVKAEAPSPAPGEFPLPAEPPKPTVPVELKPAPMVIPPPDKTNPR